MSQLPPLPEPAQLSWVMDSTMRSMEIRRFTADQMRAYAEQARAELLQRIEDLKADAGCLIKAARESHEIATTAEKASADLLAELERIANFDVIAEGETMDEWGEAWAFGRCQEIARTAIAAMKADTRTEPKEPTNG